MSATLNFQELPILILKEGSSRERGTGGQYASIMAARLLAEAVKSALGPKGLLAAWLRSLIEREKVKEWSAPCVGLMDGFAELKVTCSTGFANNMGSTQRR